MKTKIILIISFFSIFLGCSKDKVESQQNQLTFLGKNYQLTQGFEGSEGYSYSGVIKYDIGIVLLSSDFNVNLSNPAVPITGVGNGIDFVLPQQDVENISSGTYIFSRTTLTDQNYFDEGSVYINFSFENDEGGYSRIAKGGFSITIEGDIYEINFEGETENSIKFQGYYKGTLTKIKYNE